MIFRNNVFRLSGGFKNYTPLMIVGVLSTALYLVALEMHDEFASIMSLVSYLTWHNMFEFTSVLISYSVFIVAYYTYAQTRDLRAVFLGNIFLLVGILDSFHTLSFKGMPDFLVPNDGSNRATTLWIISRLIGSIGFLISAFIPEDRKSSLGKQVFLIPSVLISLLSLYLVTYQPELLPQMFIEGKGLTETKKLLEYIIMLFFFTGMVKFIYEFRASGDRSYVMLAASLLLSIFSEYAFVSYYSVYDIFNYIGHVYKFISVFIVFRVMFINSVQKPYYELKDAKNKLKHNAENLDRLVDQRTMELMQINQKLMDDLDYARDIQKSILPAVLPMGDEYSFAARYYPAERLSGDFYNIFKLDDGNIGLYIGDVSGHGVSAAMLTVFLNQTIEVMRHEDGDAVQILNPSVVLKNIYDRYNLTNFKDEIYIVMLYAVYNINTRVLTYSSAGMNAEPLIFGESKSAEEIQMKGFPICKFGGIYPVRYDDSKVKLNKGDRVLFFTDGLVEAENKAREYYSSEWLKNLIMENSSKENSSLADIIAGSVFDFIGDNPLKDDITFFIMSVN